MTKSRGVGRGRKPIHGHSPRNGKPSPTYNSWRGMIDRAKGRNDYAVQPSVCKRWCIFANFLADMGQRPAGMTIERVNNLGDYEPNNCIWAPRIIQNRNRSSTKMTDTAVAELKRLRENGYANKELAKRFGISESYATNLYLGHRWCHRKK